MPMDKKTTRILFSIDKKVASQDALAAAIYLSKKSNLSLTYVETSDSWDITNGQDLLGFQTEFKRKNFKDLEYIKQEGPFWKTLAKVAQEQDCNMVVAGAEVVKSGLFGGGMSDTVDAFNSAILYLNNNTKWIEPKVILMPLDGNSETRQKFYRVSEWAQITRSKIHVLGVSHPSDKEDERYVHTYSLQGQTYMEERKIKTTLEEVSSKDCASVILERAQSIDPCWVSAVSNTEGVFKTSAFQKVCEKSNVPVLIMPFKEISGMGGVGY